MGPEAGESGAVLALAGRRIDAPDSEPRFPPTSISNVRRKLERRFSAKVTCLVCSAACGADLLALEAAERVGIPYHVILPFDIHEFRRTSVVDRPGRDWGSLFDRIINNAASQGRLWVDDLDPNDEDSFRKANLLILRKARSTAEELGGGKTSDARAIVVWEGRTRGPDDITDHFRNEAISLGLPIETISTV